MANIAVDLNRPIKKMKPMHGGGQPPVVSSAKPIHGYYAPVAFNTLYQLGTPTG